MVYAHLALPVFACPYSYISDFPDGTFKRLPTYFGACFPEHQVNFPSPPQFFRNLHAKQGWNGRPFTAEQQGLFRLPKRLRAEPSGGSAKRVETTAAHLNGRKINCN